MKRDFDDLSPDLEWMLQSEQVDEDTLAESLARTYYPRIYQQILDLVIYPEEARKTARDTFVLAVQSAKDYNGEASVGDWLGSLAERIGATRRKQLCEHDLLNPSLIASILIQLPRKDLDTLELDREIRMIILLLRTKRRSKRIRTATLELALVIVSVVLVLVGLQYTNILSAESEEDIAPTSRAILGPGSRTGTPVPQPTPTINTTPSDFTGTTGLRGIPSQPRLTLFSSEEDIWRRLLLSRYLWKTLWADVWVELRGPPGYYGPSLVERHQLWVDQGKLAFHIGGFPDNSIISTEMIASNTLGPSPAHFLNGLDDYARLGSQLPWYYLSNHLIYTSPYLINFYLYPTNNYPPVEISYEPVAEEPWMGIQTVVVDMKAGPRTLIARLWLEDNTGIIVRGQYFTPASPEEPVLEIKLSQLYLNVEFPKRMYEPESDYLTSGYFVNDYNGGPDLENHQPFPLPLWDLPPEARIIPIPFPEEGDIDSTTFWATFPPFFFQPLEEGPVIFSGESVMQMFIGQYSMDTLTASDLTSLVCDRNANSNTMAFSWVPGTSDEFVGVIVWGDLLGGSQETKELPGVNVTRLAVAPDSRFLAAAGFELASSRGVLYVIDTLTGELVQLSETDQVWSLAWSSDSKLLATLNWAGSGMAIGNSLLVRVHDLEAGTTSHVRVEGFKWGERILEIPLESWTAEFPLPMLVVEDCFSPPVAAKP